MQLMYTDRLDMQIKVIIAFKAGATTAQPMMAILTGHCDLGTAHSCALGAPCGGEKPIASAIQAR